MMRGDTTTTVIAVRGCAIAVEVDQGLVFVGVPAYEQRRAVYDRPPSDWHLFTARELREVADAMEALQRAVEEAAAE